MTKNINITNSLIEAHGERGLTSATQFGEWAEYLSAQGAKDMTADEAACTWYPESNGVSWKEIQLAGIIREEARQHGLKLDGLEAVSLVKAGVKLGHLEAAEWRYLTEWVGGQVRGHSQFAPEAYLDYRVNPWPQYNKEEQELLGHLWWEYHLGWMPSKAVRECLAPYGGNEESERLLMNLVPNWKVFDRLLKKLGVPNQEEPWRDSHVVYAAANLAAVFGDRAEAVARCLHNGTGDSLNRESVHAAGISLRSDINSSAAEWAWSMRRAKIRRGGEVTTAWSSVVTVVNRWERMLQAGGDPTTMPLRELVVYATTREYLLKGEFQHKGFATEASRAGVEEEEYAGYETRWLKASRDSRLPDIKIQSQGLTLAFMAKDDPRGLFLGAYTGCCQHPDGAGEECAWDGVENPNSGFLVLFDKDGTILAQSWVWTQDNIMVLDNIEDMVFPEGAEKLYFSFAAEATELGYEVRLGLGYTSYEWTKTLVHVVKEDIVLPSGYTDAHEQAYLTAAEPSSTKWDIYEEVYAY